MDTDPLISVIVTLYNYEDYIEDCIGSIISQDYPNLQIIIVENGSTDRSREIVSQIKDHRIELFHIGENNGWPPAFNLGFEKVKGEWVHLFAADDVLCPTYYSRLLEEDDGSYGLIGSWMQPVDGDLEEDDSVSQKYDTHNFKDFDTRDYKEFAWRFPFGGNSFICRTELLTKVMPIPNLIPADWCLVVRLLGHGLRARIVDERLIHYRVHGNSLGNKMERMDYLIEYFFLHLTEFRPVAAKLSESWDVDLKEFQRMFSEQAYTWMKESPERVLRLEEASDAGYEAAVRWPDIDTFRKWVLRPDSDSDPAIIELRRIHSKLKKGGGVRGAFDGLVQREVELTEIIRKRDERLLRLRAELDRTKENVRQLEEKRKNRFKRILKKIKN